MRYRTLADLRERLGDGAAEQAARQIAPVAGRQFNPLTPRVKTGQRKYRNEPVAEAGEAFDSKLERNVCANLRARYGSARIIRQVSIPIGRKRMRPDFLIIHELHDDGTFRGELVDAKGHATEAWNAKANHLETQHGLKIRLIGKD